jgi:excinuclease UvrABC ATPase subunit
VSVDQGTIRGSRRSNPATYIGLLDPICKAFAKANGVIYTDLAMMSGVATTCERFR